MKTLRTLVAAGGLAFAMGGWSVANAATYTFDFSKSYNKYSNSLSFNGTKDNGVGPNILSVTASGKTGNNKAALVGTWARNGMGVLHYNNDSEHYVDNYGSDDFVLFNFGEDVNVKIERIVLKAYGDVDITVGSGDVWDQNLEDIKSDTPARKSFVTIDLSSLTAPTNNLWRIFAKVGENNDKFKIKSMTVSTVPIPAAVWLFGSALFGMAGIGYRRRSTQA